MKELEKDLRVLENCGGCEESTEDGMKSEGVGTSDEFIKTLENASAMTFALPSRYSILQSNWLIILWLLSCLSLKLYCIGNATKGL